MRKHTHKHTIPSMKLLAPVPSSSGASMATACSETAGDEALHRGGSGTLPARVGGDEMVQVELER
jgi:hypothetical protein